MTNLSRLDVEALYRRLPIPLQHVVCSVEGRRLERQRYGRDYRSVLESAKRRASASWEEASAYRDARLNAFVRHCVETVPYYRRWFAENRVDTDAVRTMADLQMLPILTKAEVQADVSDFQSETVPRRQRVATHTSGSTGAGLRFTTTAGGVREQYATWWRYRAWHGLEHGIWAGHFGAAVLDDDGCDCGRPGRVVASVDGRQEDYVELGNGARVGRMDHVFKDLTNIREAQIVQSRPGEIEVRVVRGSAYAPSDERELLREMVKRVGEETAVRIRYADRLERGPSGKLRFVVSEIPAAKLDNVAT